MPSGDASTHQIAPAFEAKCCFGRPVVMSHSVKYVEDPIEKRRLGAFLWNDGAGTHAMPSMDRPIPPLKVYVIRREPSLSHTIL